MAKSLGPDLQQTQNLSLNPTIRQLITVLNMTTLECDEEIRRALDENPVLERANADDFDDNSPTAPPRAREGESEADRITAMLSAGRRPQDEDFADVFENTAAEKSFREDLLEQIQGLRVNADGSPILPDAPAAGPGARFLSEDERRLLSYLVYWLDDRGYLKESARELIDHCPLEWMVDDEKMARAVAALRSLDPPGIGARDLRDSLLLQLERKPDSPAKALAESLLRDHYELFEKSRAKRRIADQMGKESGEVDLALRLIKSLNPYPNVGMAGESPTPYVRPDARVFKTKAGAWAVEALSNLPAVAVRKDCLDAIQEQGEDVTPDFKNEVEQAERFVQMLQMRQNTILRVAEAIVERQQGFFERGARAMLPMTLQEIADKIEMNVSTVSRATRGKYLICPSGLYEFKFFFSKNVGVGRRITAIDFSKVVDPAKVDIGDLPEMNEDELLIPDSMRSRHAGEFTSDQVSNVAIKDMIKRLIDGEDKAKPLNDAAIKKALDAKNVRIARRTVANYRVELGIPAAFKRKL